MIKFVILTTLLLTFSCAGQINDEAKKNAKNSAASSRLNESQENNSTLFDELDD